MTDKIDFGSEPWQAIPSRVLRDPRLSLKAKGGLCTLLSHEEGWVRSCVAILMKENRCGRTQAQAVMAELRGLGYAELIRERALDGTLSSHYVVSATPTPVSSGSLVGGKPARRETRPSVEPSVEVEALDVEPLEVDPLVTSKSPSGLFKEVTPDQMYLASRIEDSKGKTLTPKALQKLNVEFGTAEVTSALRRLHGFPPPDPIGSVYAYVESLCTLSKESA